MASLLTARDFTATVSLLPRFTEQAFVVRTNFGLAFALFALGPGPFITTRSNCCGGRAVHRGKGFVCHKCMKPTKALPYSDEELSQMTPELVHKWVSEVLPAHVNPLDAALLQDYLSDFIWAAAEWMLAMSALEDPTDEEVAVPLQELYQEKAETLSGSLYR